MFVYVTVYVAMRYYSSVFRTIYEINIKHITATASRTNGFLLIFATFI